MGAEMSEMVRGFLFLSFYLRGDKKATWEVVVKENSNECVQYFEEANEEAWD